MKKLTLSLLSLTAACVTVGAQDSAVPAPSTAQADKQFLRQLERIDPAPPAANPLATAPAAEKQPEPAPVAKQAAPARTRRATESGPVKTTERSQVASTSSERSSTEVHPSEKRSKKETAPKVAAANTERIAPTAPGNEEVVEARPVRRVNQNRTARTTSLDPFYDTAGRSPASEETKPVKTSRSSVQLPAEVAAETPQSVTVTRTVTTIPAPAPKEEDNGFFHRLFHHKDHSEE